MIVLIQNFSLFLRTNFCLIGVILMLTKERKAELITKYGGNAANTGNSEAQIALLTENISALSTHLELNKKDLVISIVTEHDMRLTAIIDSIHSRMIKQGLDPRCLDESKAHYPSGMIIKKEIKLLWLFFHYQYFLTSIGLAVADLVRNGNTAE